jgi:hypothetical protein
MENDAVCLKVYEVLGEKGPGISFKAFKCG